MKQFLLLASLLLTMALGAQNTPLKVNLYPNPASDYIRFSFNEVVTGDITFTISDILGNKLETITVKASESNYIDLSHLKLNNGMYLIKIETGSSTFLKRLLIKNA